MKFTTLARDCVFRSFRNWRLWLLQLFGNPALFALLAVWLLIPVAESWQLAANMLLALVLLAGALALQGGTMRYFHESQDARERPLASAFLGALRNVLPILVCAAIVYVAWRWLGRLDQYQELFPAYLRSTLPASARRHVTLPFLNSLFSAMRFFLRWIAIPGLFLPFIMKAAQDGFRVFSKAGLSAWGKSVWSVSYWALMAAAALIGVLLPSRLMGATPNFNTSTYRLELTSLIVRLFFSYLLGVFAWMFACSLAGRNRHGSDSSAIPSA